MPLLDQSEEALVELNEKDLQITTMRAGILHMYVCVYVCFCMYVGIYYECERV
jgi:hypothetical protein